MTTSSNWGCSALLAKLLTLLLNLFRRKDEIPTPEQYFNQTLPFSALPAPHGSQFTVDDLIQSPSGGFMITIHPINGKQQTLNIDAACADPNVLVDYLNSAQVNFSIFPLDGKTNTPNTNI